MAGIYIHIPFCRQACTYCDFHFSTSLHYRSEIVKSILKELELRAPHWQDFTMQSIYFGGGTPSQLLPEEIYSIFNAIYRNYRIMGNAEITFEANPEDLNSKYIDALKDNGINRLSIGIQSFDDNRLIKMNRAHSARQAIACVHEAAKAGIDSISIDLIYGIPGLSNHEWETTLNQAVNLPINHLSCYALTVEQGTPLAKLIRTGKQANTDDEQAEQHFRILQNFSKNAGWLHYEVSNLALPGAEAVHNSAYWTGEPYLGIGPSAHSYDGENRRMNIANNMKYMTSLQVGDAAHEIEQRREYDQFNEWILTGFRTLKGIPKKSLESSPQYLFDYFLKQWSSYPEQNILESTQDAFILKPEAWFRADGIASDFFYLP